MIIKTKKIKGGVFLPHLKHTSAISAKKLPIPELIEIPMQQHIGAPCEVKVQKKDYVYVGQVIGDTDKYVSAPIHSGVSGTVENIKDYVLYDGSITKSVVIKTDGLQQVLPDLQKPVINSKEDFFKAVRDSGMTGLGGAGFPTHVKLNTGERAIESLVVNAVECEPYLTSDYRAILEDGESIIKGISFILDQLSIPEAIIGIEDDKPLAVKKLQEHIKLDERIKVAVLNTKYPQGAEKMLIYAVTGLKVPMGGLPIDVGVVVMNVNTVLPLYNYIQTGMPLVTKRITVDGSAVAKRGNFIAPIGMYIKDIFEFCGGRQEELLKTIYGGPMMGITVQNLDTPVLKLNNGFLFMSAEDTDTTPESACIRCARCVDACPMSLMPLILNRYALANDAEMLTKYNITNCIECGSCAYVCPANRYLVQSFRIGKDIVRKQKVKND